MDVCKRGVEFYVALLANLAELQSSPSGHPVQFGHRQTGRSRVQAEWAPPGRCRKASCGRLAQTETTRGFA